MEINLGEAIERSKDIMLNSRSLSSRSVFSKYSKTFFVATENIAGSLIQEKFNKERSLTVLSCGDHVFNLAYSGVQEIDAFDVDVLTYFTYFLRKAMLERLSYDEFINFNYYFICGSYLNELKEKLELLKSSMPEEVYEYYRKILEIAMQLNVSLSALYYNPRNIKKVNSYLKNEAEFLKLKNRINEVKVNLYFGDARDLQFDNSYGVILLSNIADYFGTVLDPLDKEKFMEFITKYGNLLNEDGVLINYLYHLNSMFVIDNSTITRDDLGKSNLRSFDGSYFKNEGYYRVRRKNDVLCL